MPFYDKARSTQIKVCAVTSEAGIMVLVSGRTQSLREMLLEPANSPIQRLQFRRYMDNQQYKDVLCELWHGINPWSSLWGGQHGYWCSDGNLDGEDNSIEVAVQHTIEKFFPEYLEQQKPTIIIEA